MSWFLEAAAKGAILIGLGAVATTRLHHPGLQTLVWRGILFCCLLMPVLLVLGRHMAAPPFVAVPPLDLVPVFHLLPHGSDAAAIRGPVWRIGDLAGPVYLCGLFILLFRMALGLLRGAALCRRARPTEGTGVRISDAVAGPAVFGRTILLPRAAENWTASCRDTVLAHECAHLRHGDFPVLCLAELHRALFWFDPAAWWLQRRLALLAEMRSDDAAIPVAGGVRAYAAILSATGTPDRRAALMPMASPSRIGPRLRRMEDWMPPGRAGRTKRLSLGAAVLSAGAITALAGQAATGTALSADAVARQRYEQARPRTAIPVTPAIRDRFLGTFRLTATSALTVSAAGDGLYAQISGQQKLPVYPDRDGELFFAALSAQLTAQGGGSGPADVLVLHQNGLLYPAPRLSETDAAALEARLAERIRRNQPRPGSEQALRSVLTAIRNGDLSASDASPDMVAALQPRLAIVRAMLNDAGATRAIAFLGIGHGGWDVFRVTCDTASFRVPVQLDDRNRVSGISFQYMP